MTAKPLERGSVIHGFRVERVIGRGGLAVVYEATQLSLERPVALKILGGALASDPEFVERFRREGRLQASLEHPHVITIYEAGESEHGLFQAMRLLRGPTLAQLISERALDPERALRLLGQVAGALDAAHAAGLVHRDVKPQNVLVGDGDHAYLADFGLTKVVGGTPKTDREALAQMLRDCLNRQDRALERIELAQGAAASADVGDARVLATALVHAASEALGVPDAPPRAPIPAEAGAHPASRKRARLAVAGAACVAVAAIAIAVVSSGDGEQPPGEAPARSERAGSDEAERTAGSVTPRQVTGARAAGAAAGRLLAEHRLSVGGEGRQLAVVLLPEGVALDLFQGDRRLARLDVPDADPRGRLVTISNDGASLIFTWRNVPPASPLVHRYQLEPASIELIN